MSDTREEKAARIRELMATEGESVRENTLGFNRDRYESTGALEDYDALKDQARAIKEDAIARLPELIDEVTETVEERGGRVYLAEDAVDANQYCLEVVEERDADSVVKSKSMTTEELAVNEALEAAGVSVWETDLGEFVLQVADESPSHIVTPAIHKSRDAIADLFNRHFDLEEPLTSAEELTAFAREYLGERIRSADVGMTGANFIAADTGTLAIVASEGNARKCVVAPDVHVAVAGVEKLVPSVTDMQPFVELIARSGLGQDITSYLSLFAPPVETPTLDFEADETGTGEREFHLVLVDNGRMAMRDDDVLRETLYCIRCSACLNSCANFQAVGGHAFGGETYSGGIATGWEAGVHGQDSAAAFNDLCTGCTRCVNQCPVGIDIPWINTAVRDRINQGQDPSAFDFVFEGLTPDEEPPGLDVQKRLFGNFETLASVGSATAPASNWLANLGPSRVLLERVFGVDTRRDLPRFRRETLRRWAEARDSLNPAEADHEVVLFADLYTNHVRVERGKAAVRALEALDVAVRVPDVPSTGREPLSQGMVETARQKAATVADVLEPHLDDGLPVVVIEPSDHAMVQRDYERLLPPERADHLQEHTVEVMAYIGALLEEDPEKAEELVRSDEETASVAYHSHCQQRTLGLERPTVEVLESLDYDVLTSDAECCGMAGSFGYKREYYELSMSVGELIAEQFNDAEMDDRVLLASGTSCLEQLDALFERSIRHPIELIAPSAPSE